jgi:hypothetical protein
LNVHSLNWEEHFNHLQYDLMRWREVNFKLNPNKCEFAKFKLVFLVHEVSREGTQPNQKKKKLLQIFPSLLLLLTYGHF